jgi:hypothetical protein
MKVPTDATKVFSPVAYTGNGSANRSITGYGFPPDVVLSTRRNAVDGDNTFFTSKLTGISRYLTTSTTDAETYISGRFVASYDQDGINLGTVISSVNNATGTYILQNFRRAPSFFDEVCYTGTGSNTTQAHNLGVVPELIICKSRSVAGQWPVYSAGLANTEYLNLEVVDAKSTGTTVWNSTTPTASVFSLGSSIRANQSGTTYVAYLFATTAGVSKVGSYTGTGTTKQIDCGFTAGARFVLIKRTDSTGDWYVWDTARGIVAGNDSYLLLNSTAAEVTSTDYIDTYSAGFEISSTAPAAINASAGTYIFLAIA